MREEVLKELLEAVVTAIDLLGIDVKTEFPNLYEEMKQQNAKQ